jgi:hypothetical protein
MRQVTTEKGAALRRRLLLFLLLAFVSLSAIARAEERHFDLALKAGALPKNLQTIKVNQGNSVELKWTSDQPIKMHLHGYDMEIAVKPGEPTVTAINAKIAGRFSVEKLAEKGGGHHHGGKILYFEVHP